MGFPKNLKIVDGEVVEVKEKRKKPKGKPESNEGGTTPAPIED